jgi:beta-galactosidase
MTRLMQNIIRVTGFVLLMLAFFQSSLKAQDTLYLKGAWKIQPAKVPQSMPINDNWGTTNGVDFMVDWRSDLNSGKNTSWEKVVRDSVHNLWYERQVLIPAHWENKRIALDFRRIEGDAIVFVNNIQAAEVLRPGGEINISSFLKYGETNTIRVFVTRNYTGISRNFEADLLRYYTRKLATNPLAVNNWGLGITAPVKLIARGPMALTDVFCTTSFRKQHITFQTEINAEKSEEGTQLIAEIIDQNGKTVLKVASDVFKANAGKSQYAVTADWKNATYWELDQPYLYTAKISLVKNGQVLSSYPQFKFGFREIWTKGKDLYMNGHLSRWHLTDLYGTNKNGLGLYRLMGYNVGQIQPSSNFWWRNIAETPIIAEDLLNEMDKLGMGCTLPAPGVGVLRQHLINNQALREEFKKETEYHIKFYRNHPSILAWVVSMNSTNPKLNIWPQGMGKRDSIYSGQGKVIDLGTKIVKLYDTTRLAFSHADGSVGDMSTANVYLNFLPMQEREEWPMEWAKNGNMPYSAVEFGTPYWHNFYKGNQLLLSEYLAMYRGDQAYKKEGENGLSGTLATSILPNGTSWEQLDLKQYPAFWDVQQQFVRQTNRSWRTWGINGGWLNWVLEGYGNPPDNPNTRFTARYKALKAPITSKPSWVNERFEIFKVDNQPLLIYIAGGKIHTDKTHTFYAGTAFQKQIAVVWDGAVQKKITANWYLKQGNRILQQGSKEMVLKAGEINLTPFDLVAPKVSTRTDLKLILNAFDQNVALPIDTFNITVFPKVALTNNPLKISIYDPKGLSALSLKKIGIKANVWKKGNSLSPTNLLIIGREALQAGDDLPYTATDLNKGLRVIILEQQPEVWEGMGFQSLESMSRTTFIRDQASPVFKGLKESDFSYWKGSPNLLPEGKLARDYDTQKAPKWTNRHAVASLVLKTPEIGGFTPLVQTEFDMAYSPLIEYRYGKGSIIFSTFEVSGQLGNEPAADQLMVNLINAQSKVLPTQYQASYSGDTTSSNTLAKLGIGVKTTVGQPNSNGILIVGNQDNNLTKAQLNAFAQNGGTVIFMRQPAAKLTAMGYTVSSKAIYRATAKQGEGLLRAVGPNLLRWRDVINVDVFNLIGQPAGSKVTADGLLLEQTIGKGKWIFMQVQPDLLEGRYENEVEKKEAIQLSVIRLRQLLAQLITNAGAKPSAETTERLTRVVPPPNFQTLGAWKLLGPYIVEGLDGKLLLQTHPPGEQDAIDGAENPNITYKRADGKMLDWRTVVHADVTGFVNLSKAFAGIDENAIAYVTRYVSSDRDQMATLRLGVDFWMEAFLNGKSILQVDKGHHKRANEYVLEVPLKKGENILTLKVGSGRGGFGFWANIGLDANPSTTVVKKQSNLSFYQPLFKHFDPYQFSYW